MKNAMIETTKNYIEKIRTMITNNELTDDEKDSISPFADGSLAVFDIYIEKYPESEEDISAILDAAEVDKKIGKLVDAFLDEIEDELLPENFYEDED